MSDQYHLDQSRVRHPAARDGQPHPNAWTSVVAMIDGHPGHVRRARPTAEPTTYFSIPARASIGGRTVSGFLTVDTTTAELDGGRWTFHPYDRHAAHVRAALEA